MGNRSKYVAATAVAAGILGARRRARLRAAAEGIRTTILPTHGHDWPSDSEPVGEGHAPGHAHLEQPATEDVPRAWRRLRPWARRGLGKNLPHAHY